MKKMRVLLLLILIVVGVYISKLDNVAKTFNSAVSPFIVKKDNLGMLHKKKTYYVKSGHKIKGYFNHIEKAIKVGERYRRSVVIDSQSEKWVWNNYSPFIIITEHGVQDFDTLESAIYYAERNSHDEIHWKGNSEVIWSPNQEIPEEIMLDVPVIHQYPELPRGCEVTSLAMVLSYWDINTNKMELAERVKKDTTAYSKAVDGKIRFGNPYNGFVGDMYNISNDGYGVYHEPIVELAEQYTPDQVIDFTGVDFEILLGILSKGMLVWVVANSRYKHLPEEEFEIWHTPTGIVKITYREHAVVVTGYSDGYVYINDPLKSKQNIKVNKDEFIKAWVQMGSQAVVVYNEES